MKKLFVFLLAVPSVISYAQSNEVTLDELTSPNTPAFNILGLNPTEISKPTTGRALMLNFANSFESSKGIGSDIAIEFTPYWITPHPDLKFNDYYKIDKTSDTATFEDRLLKFGSNIVQTSALSFATSKVEGDSLNARNLGMGIKMQFMTGRPSDDFRAIYHSMKYNDKLAFIFDELSNKEIKTFEALKTELSKQVENVVNTSSSFEEKQKKQIKKDFQVIIENMIKEADLNETSSKKAIAAFIKKSIDDLDQEQIVNNKKLKENHINNRVGLIWDFSFASSLLLPTNEIDFSYGNKWAIWTNFGYRTDNAKNNFILMVRRQGDYINTSVYNADYGLSYVWSGARYNVSLEAILRNYHTQFQVVSVTGETYDISKNDYTNRFAVSFQYKLTDFINVSASIGKDYDDNITTNGNLFSLLNINLLLPEKQTLKMK
jgi:hypothetical protein